METGRILKALSGFYYVEAGDGSLLACRARGILRRRHVSPLVGDRVEFTRLEGDCGVVEALLPRKNAFSRPAVANVDQLVIVASGAAPATDPFLIDRMTCLAEGKGCGCVVCVNKCDLDRADGLYGAYRAAGFPTVRVSARTGEGLEELAGLIAGSACAFTGNSGVGKSSLLNALEPDLSLRVGQISARLGRGRNTTRHVELFRLGNGALAADTPGFSAFDPDQGVPKEDLAGAFREFRPYVDGCRFAGCSHTREKGCAVLEAVRAGRISPSRHASYVRLYEAAAARPAKRFTEDPHPKKH